MLITPGKYKHYKGGEYEVLFLAKFSDNGERELEDMVVYKQLYNTPDIPYGTIWVRSLKEFIEKVEIEGKMIERYVKIQ